MFSTLKGCISIPLEISFLRCLDGAWASDVVPDTWNTFSGGGGGGAFLGSVSPAQPLGLAGPEGSVPCHPPPATHQPCDLGHFHFRTSILPNAMGGINTTDLTGL